MTQYKWVEEEIKTIKEINKDNPERLKKMMKDYEEKGWSDRDTWSLDYTIACFVLPRLKRFKEVKNGGDKKWNKVLTDMIIGFELMSGGSGMWTDTKSMKKINKALDLFREYFLHLWW